MPTAAPQLVDTTGPPALVTSKGVPPATESVTEVIVTGSTPEFVMVAVNSTSAPGSSTEAAPASLSTEMPGSVSVKPTVASSVAVAELPSSSATVTVATLWCASPALPERNLVTSQRELSGPVPGWPSAGARTSPARPHSAVMSPKTVSTSDVISTASAAVFSITNPKVTSAPCSDTEVCPAVLVMLTVGTTSLMSTRASSLSAASLPSSSLASTSTTSRTVVPPAPETSTVKVQSADAPGSMLDPTTVPHVVAFTTEPVVAMSIAGPPAIESVSESTWIASMPGLDTATAKVTSAPGSATLAVPAVLVTSTRGVTSSMPTLAPSESSTTLSSLSCADTVTTSATTSPASPSTNRSKVQLVDSPGARVRPTRSSQSVTASAVTSRGAPPSTESTSESISSGSTLVLVMPTVKVTVSPGSSTEETDALLVTPSVGFGARLVNVHTTSSPGPTRMSPTADPSLQVADTWVQRCGVSSTTE